jgi:RNA polymerase sigma-70 factor (ECF subfamily)
MLDGAVSKNDGDEPPDDDELVRRARDGDRDAFGALYERYRRSVLGGFQCMGLSSEESWDLTQETFLHAWRGLHTLRTGEEIRFGGWLRTIARNVFRKYWAAKDRRRTIRIDPELFPELEGSAAADPKAASITLEHHAAVRACLDTLDNDGRSLVLLRIVHGAPFRRIASLVGWAEATVRYRLKQALADLRGCLERNGVTGI